MKKYVVLLIVILIGACNTENTQESNSCSILVDGVYQYPDNPADPSWSDEVKREYWNIPEDVLICISTKGLVESCYKTPRAAYIIAASGCQDGYNLVKSGCRGFDELEMREDTAEELISKYETVNPVEADKFHLFLLEMAIAQNNIIHKMTVEQKTEILELALSSQAKKKAVAEEDVINWEATTIVMGRILLFENYAPFESVCENNSTISGFIINGYQLSMANADTIMFYTKQFVNQYTQ